MTIANISSCKYNHLNNVLSAWIYSSWMLPVQRWHFLPTSLTASLKDKETFIKEIGVIVGCFLFCACIEKVWSKHSDISNIGVFGELLVDHRDHDYDGISMFDKKDFLKWLRSRVGPFLLISMDFDMEILSNSWSCIDCIYMYHEIHNSLTIYLVQW